MNLKKAYKIWLKETKRGGSVLIGSSVREFLDWYEKNHSFVIEKHEVCAKCLAIGIKSNDCVCTYRNDYATIELEFKLCSCCGEIKDEPIDSEFNNSQYEKLNRKET